MHLWGLNIINVTVLFSSLFNTCNILLFSYLGKLYMEHEWFGACWCSAPTGLGVACSAPSARSSPQPHWPCLLLAAGFLWQPRLVHTAPQSIPLSLPLSRATHVSFQTLLDTNMKPSSPASSRSTFCAMCVTVSERASVRLYVQT